MESEVPTVSSQVESPFSPPLLAVLEALLRQHPGVSAAKASSHHPQLGQVTVHVVPNDEYLASFLKGDAEERKRLQTWRKTFDLTQLGKEAASAEVGFNIAGWNSSYARQPIPEPAMREWVAHTVAEILSFAPQEILEIGCGTGLLLLRIASQCKRYTATDFAPAVLGKLRQQLEVMPGSWEGVSLLERAADDFTGMAEDSFDTVVINSVLHYFPSVSYLIRVLEGAARVLKPGGRIFIGDVRSLPLLKAYCASVELYQAEGDVPLNELRERVTRRRKLQDQLVISPAFFLAFGERNAKISDVEIRVKRGRHDNELTRYRYNAVLHARSEPNNKTTVPWMEWTNLQHGRADLQRVLREEQPETLAIRGIPNARLNQDLFALKRIFDPHASATVADLQADLLAQQPNGIHPEFLHDDGDLAGYRVDLSWARCPEDGSYDAVFSRKNPNHQQSIAVDWPQLSTAGADLWTYVNVLGANSLRQRLARELETFCQQQAPPEFQSCSIQLVDSLPATD